MAFTLTQLEALEAAIASGHSRVTYDGKTVEYQSTADMLRARDAVRSALIADGLLSVSSTARGSATLAEFDRG